jgi:hemoglobin/transferrin/lactoferrin receptor protein
MHAATRPLRLRALSFAVTAALVAAPLSAQLASREGAKRDAAVLDAIEVIGERPLPDVQDRLQRGQARTVRDLFDLDARINVGGGSRNGQRLYVRGIEGSNLNVTVDGARQGQNLYNHRGGQGNVDPEILKRVEVAPGPVAADAGYGALGGAVRFTTVDAQDRLGEGDGFGAAVKAGYASAADSRRVSATAFGMAAESLGLLVHATAQDFDDLRTGGGVEVPFSGGEDRSVLAKLSLLDVQGHSLRIGLERNEASGLNFMQRGDYPWQLQPIDLRARPPQEQDLTRSATTLRYRFAPGGELVDLQVNAADTRDDFFAPGSNGERFISSGRSVDLRNVSRWRTGGVETDVTYGLEWVEQTGTAEQNSGVRFFRTGSDNLGAFAQARLHGERWDLSFGGRSDDYDADYGARTSDGRESSLNLSGQWRFDGGLRVHGGYGEAIRGFGTIPLQFTRNIASTLTFNGRADGELRPERGRQSEYGLGWAGENVLGARQFELGLKRYLTRLQDVILFDQPGTGGLGGRPVRGFSNAFPSVRFEGTELVARWSGERYDTTLTAIDASTKNLALQPQFLARTAAPVEGKLVWDSRYALSDAWSIGYTFSAVEGLDAAPAGQEVFIARPGYALHDVQLTWRSPQTRQWGVAFAINNLFDRRYSNLATFTQAGFATDEAGRDVRLTVDYAF